MKGLVFHADTVVLLVKLCLDHKLSVPDVVKVLQYSVQSFPPTSEANRKYELLQSNQKDANCTVGSSSKCDWQSPACKPPCASRPSRTDPLQPLRERPNKLLNVVCPVMFIAIFDILSLFLIFVSAVMFSCYGVNIKT